MTASPHSAAGALRTVTWARAAIATSTRKRPYSAQPSATHGSASWAAKNSGAAKIRTTQRPSSTSPATTTPVNST